MKNFKLVNHCWSCNKEHDLSDQLIQNNIKCDCGGYVITPSGKGLHEIKLNCNVYRFDDGENHWIAASTQDEAIKFFEGEYGNENEYDVKLVNDAELNEKMIDNIEFLEEDGVEWISLKQIVLQSERLPSLIASSVY
jgi:hypothetical protein